MLPMYRKEYGVAWWTAQSTNSEVALSHSSELPQLIEYTVLGLAGIFQFDYRGWGIQHEL